MILGLGGAYCSGKTSFLPYFQQLGFEPISLDQLGHQALEAKKSEILKGFGQEILDDQGKIHRPTLGKIVFSHPQGLKKLESIVHPWMVMETKKKLASEKEKNFLIEGALLYPMGLAECCDLVFWIEAPWWKRLLRGMKRDKIGFFQVLRRMGAQKRIHPQRFPKKVDSYKVRNKGSLEKAWDQIRRILKSRDQ